MYASPASSWQKTNGSRKSRGIASQLYGIKARSQLNEQISSFLGSRFWNNSSPGAPGLEL